MTTFDQYWLAVKRALSRLMLVSLALAVLMVVITERIGPIFEVHFSYLISLSERNSLDEYEFDGYYALQAMDLFSVTLSEWLKTPEVIIEAHRATGLSFTGLNARDLSQIVTSNKPAPQLVTVMVRHHNEQSARKIAEGLIEVMEKNIKDYHEQGVPVVKFKVVATTPWLGSSKSYWGVVAGSTFILSLFFLINSLLLWQSFKIIE